MSDTIYTLNEIDNLEIARAFECDPNQLDRHLHVSRNDLTIISQNIRSIYCNFDDFLLTLTTLKFEVDVIILTECRLDFNKPIPILPNYHSYSTKHQLNQNDGVVVFVKSTLRHKVQEIKITHGSCIQLDILNNTILCIYRSPSNSNSEMFLNSLCSHIETLQTKKGIIIAGDININIATKQTESYQEKRNRTLYLDTLSSYGILAAHTIPTRGINCLDHFMIRINKIKVLATIAVMHTSITDHLTTLLTISKLKKQFTVDKTRTKINFEEALESLKNKNLAELLFYEDPTKLLDLLILKLTESIQENTVICKVPKKYRTIKPWITKGILRCIQNRNKLQKQARSEPHNNIIKITYIRYRNFCNKLIKKLKRNYEKELLTKTIHNNRLLWKNVSKITYSNKVPSIPAELLNIKATPAESVNFVNNYFSNIGKDLAQQIIPNHTDAQRSYLDNLPTQPNSFVLLPTDNNEVNSVMMNLKLDSAAGWDNIPTRFLKLAKNEIIPIITHLTNLSFEKGIFPFQLKQSIITPVYKGGDRDDVGNYRPISVLPAISKILERLINLRLLSYLNEFDILSSSQYGFRKGKSTEDAIVNLSSLIIEQLDSHRKCVAVFLDLKKAFDTVSIPILVHKLEKVGIRGTALCLLKDYLLQRTQRVKVGNLISETSQVTYGVPQGSVLGPTLFLIYINDLCNMLISNANIISYADDTAVIFKGTSWKSVMDTAEQGLHLMNRWLRNNLLTLNTSKTNYISFSIYSNTQPNNNFEIKIHNTHCTSVNDNSKCNCPILPRVSQVKYLGVYVDQRLTWYPHLEHVAARIRKLIWIFKTLRHVVPATAAEANITKRNILGEIYVSLVQSIIVYCVSVWGGAAKTRFLEVERAQRRLIKVMHFKKRRFPTEALYSITNILSVRKLYILNIIMKTHKTIPYDPTKNINKRLKHKVARMQKCNTKFASSQFKQQSVGLYNKINKILKIYHKCSRECKKNLTKWLHEINYEEAENLLVS